MKKFLPFAGFAILSALFIFWIVTPEKSSAIALCSTVTDPSVKITIAGQTFTSDGTITVAAGSQLPFTVWTYAEPSSVNYISYPNSSASYPGPCGYMCPSGRSYTTAPINGTEYINVDIAQNCQDDGVFPPEASLSLTINLGCTINSFTCSSNDTLSWSTSNCSSRSISPTFGSVTSVGSTQGSPGVAYTLTAGSNTANAFCPALPSPQLKSVWSESNSTTINKTVTPGNSITIPFIFSNIGESQSTILIEGCPPSASGLDAQTSLCSGTLTAP